MRAAIVSATSWVDSCFVAYVTRIGLGMSHLLVAANHRASARASGTSLSVGAWNPRSNAGGRPDGTSVASGEASGRETSRPCPVHMRARAICRAGGSRRADGAAPVKRGVLGVRRSHHGAPRLVVGSEPRRVHPQRHAVGPGQQRDAARPRGCRRDGAHWSEPTGRSRTDIGAPTDVALRLARRARDGTPDDLLVTRPRSREAPARLTRAKGDRGARPGLDGARAARAVP